LASDRSPGAALSDRNWLPCSGPTSGAFVAVTGGYAMPTCTGTSDDIFQHFSTSSTNDRQSRIAHRHPWVAREPTVAPLNGLRGGTDDRYWSAPSSVVSIVMPKGPNAPVACCRNGVAKQGPTMLRVPASVAAKTAASDRRMVQIRLFMSIAGMLFTPTSYRPLGSSAQVDSWLVKAPFQGRLVAHP